MVNDYAKYNPLQGLNLDVKLEEKQLKQATGAVYFLAAAIIFNALRKGGKKR